MTRRDLLVALTEALPQGAPAAAVERMAGALTDATGPVTPGSARSAGTGAGVDVAGPTEQRWSAAAVARSFRLYPELVDRARLGAERSEDDRPFGRGALANDVARGHPSPLGPRRDRHAGWDRSDRVVAR